MVQRVYSHGIGSGGVALVYERRDFSPEGFEFQTRVRWMLYHDPAARYPWPTTNSSEEIARHLGFKWFFESADDDWRQTWHYVIFPAWLPVLLLAVVPVRWLCLWRGRWRRQRRAAAGLCVHCGYDLRVTPERCPECGAVNHTSPTR